MYTIYYLYHTWYCSSLLLIRNAFVSKFQTISLRLSRAFQRNFLQNPVIRAKSEMTTKSEERQDVHFWRLQNVNIVWRRKFHRNDLFVSFSDDVFVKIKIKPSISTTKPPRKQRLNPLSWKECTFDLRFFTDFSVPFIAKWKMARIINRAHILRG